MSTPYNNIYRDPFEDQAVADQCKMAIKMVSDSLINLDARNLESNQESTQSVLRSISDPDLMEMMIDHEKTSRMLDIGESTSSAFSKILLDDKMLPLDLVRNMSQAISQGEMAVSARAHDAQELFHDSQLSKNLSTKIVHESSKIIANDTRMRRDHSAATFLISEIATGNEMALNKVTMAVMNGYNKGMSQTESIGRLFNDIATDNDLYAELKLSGVRYRAQNAQAGHFTVHNGDEIAQKSLSDFQESYLKMRNNYKQKQQSYDSIYDAGLKQAFDDNIDRYARKTDLGSIKTSSDLFDHMRAELSGISQSSPALNEKIPALAKTFETFLSNEARKEMDEDKLVTFSSFSNAVLKKAVIERDFIAPTFNIQDNSIAQKISNDLMQKDPLMLRVAAVTPKANLVEALYGASVIKENEKNLSVERQSSKSKESAFSR